MKETKFIIVTGMSGAGKSTTSQNIAKQYQLNDIPYFWLHEEIGEHPIRHYEFSAGDRETEEGMDKNVLEMYDRWRKLVEKIKQTDEVYIMEGCLYQNIIRYFLNAHYPIEKITKFYDTVMKILEPLNPTLVFLYRRDVKASFREAFKIRGKRWENIILDPEGEGYFKKYEYKGDESIYAMWEHYQKISHQMFERFNGYKIKFDTLDGLWDDYMKELTAYLGLSYKNPYKALKVTDKDKYCGTYGVKLDNHVTTLEFKLDNNELYCQSWFWSNMKLIYLGNDEFEVQSFPIKFKFHFKDNKKCVDVLGIYGWHITGKRLCEMKRC